jgi:hypothetical protein
MAALTSQVSKEAFDRVTAMAMPIGRRVGAGELLEATRLPRPWPELVERMVAISDELECQVQVERYRPAARQWNPLSGRWPYDTGDLFDARGRLALYAIRAVPGAMRLRAEAMYRVVHETAHMMVVELGWRGLFRSEPTLVHAHVYGELFAELVSHYELGVSARDYWGGYWRPCVEGIAQAVNAGHAAVEAGLASVRDRAQLIASAYYEQIPSKLEPERLRADAQLLAAWTMQRQYAAKSWRACRLWQAQYWGHPAIQAFIADFVPEGPAEVWIAGREEPLRIATVLQALERTPVLLAGWRPPPAEIAAGLGARRAVQRAALAVCQLLRLVEYPDLHAGEATRGRLRAAVLGARGELLALYRSIRVGDPPPRGVRRRARRVTEELSARMAAIAGAPALRYLHPACHGASMHDPQIDLRPLSRLRWHRTPARRKRTLTGVKVALDQLVVDLRGAVERGAGEATRRRLHEAAQLVLETRLLDGAGPDDPRGPDLIARLGRWYDGARADGSLALSYPVEWLHRYPFVDPLVGYFVQ